MKRAMKGQRQDPDGAVEPAGNPDPGPQIGDADHEARGIATGRVDTISSTAPAREVWR
jgi:hypothetical protein